MTEKHTKYIIMSINKQNLLLETTYVLLNDCPSETDHDISVILINYFWHISP